MRNEKLCGIVMSKMTRGTSGVDFTQHALDIMLYKPRASSHHMRPELLPSK